MNFKLRKNIISIILALVIVAGFSVPCIAAEDTEKSFDKVVLEDTLKYIKQAVPKPSYGVVSGEWSVFDRALSGAIDDEWYSIYLDSILGILKENNGILHERKYTEYSRVVMALTPLGIDANHFNGLSVVGHLLDKDEKGDYVANWQGRNGTAYALIALDCGGYFDNKDGQDARANFIDTLVLNQRENGSWSISDTIDYSDIDVTGIIVQALAPYYMDEQKLLNTGAKATSAELKAAVDKALVFFKENSQNHYGSVEAATQVVIALCALGRDPSNDNVVGNALESVYAYYLGDGQWTHLLSDSGAASAGEVNQMAVEQAAYALLAYSAYKEGKNLFDLGTRVQYNSNVSASDHKSSGAAEEKAPFNIAYIVLIALVLVFVYLVIRFKKKNERK